jgi:hypothetical protein
MFLRTTALIGFMAISASSFSAGHEQAQNAWEPTEKKCVSVGNQISKHKGDAQKMSWLNQHKAACKKAGLKTWLPFVVSKKKCESVDKGIAKFSDNKKKMSWLSDHKAQCVKAGF